MFADLFMKLPFFYIESFDETSTPLHLDENTSHHVVQVLRMKPTEQIQLTDGKGNLYTATILDAHKKKCLVSVDEKSMLPERSSKVSIAISPIKNNSRFEWFLEKATEIGVSEIIPLVCTRTEKHSLKMERLEHILISAMLQSRQTWKPILTEPTEFSVLLNTRHTGIKLIAHCESDADKIALAGIQPAQDNLILIGPEGDFTAAEIEKAVEKNFKPVSIGNTRLRTETAGMVAATLLAYRS